MKTHRTVCFFIFALVMTGFQQCKAQHPQNWTENQLLEPSALARTLQSEKELPVLFCVGPGAIIPHSIDIGTTGEAKNLEKFKKAVSQLPKNSNIVIYCGCCPFEHCPNVRPAIAVLQEMKFTNYHLLNLPHNIKTDWIEKGYPEVKR